MSLRHWFLGVTDDKYEDAEFSFSAYKAREGQVTVMVWIGTAHVFTRRCGTDNFEFAIDEAQEELAGALSELVLARRARVVKSA